MYWAGSPGGSGSPPRGAMSTSGLPPSVASPGSHNPELEPPIAHFHRGSPDHRAWMARTRTAAWRPETPHRGWKTAGQRPNLQLGVEKDREWHHGGGMRLYGGTSAYWTLGESKHEGYGCPLAVYVTTKP